MLVLAVQVFAFLQRTAALDDFVELLYFVEIQCDRQANAVEAAVAAIDLVVMGSAMPRATDVVGFQQFRHGAHL